MSNTYTWQIEQIKTRPQYQGKTDVVHEVAWRFNATDGQFSATSYGSMRLDDPTGQFTPYDQLTEAQVIEWVKDKLGADRIAKIQQDMDTGITNQAAPQEVTKPLPWMPKP